MLLQIEINSHDAFPHFIQNMSSEVFSFAMSALFSTSETFDAKSICTVVVFPMLVCSG